MRKWIQYRILQYPSDSYDHDRDEDDASDDRPMMIKGKSDFGNEKNISHAIRDVTKKENGEIIFLPQKKDFYFGCGREVSMCMQGQSSERER